MLADIAPVGRSPRSGGYRRFAWSADDASLRTWFNGEAGKLGLDVTEDRVGNQWAWWGDPDTSRHAGRPGVVTGSHLDSVPDGGNFDGPLGVASAFAAVAALKRDGFRPGRPIGIANFVDEEGARFGVACAGSRLLTGSLSPTRALALKDADGIDMAEALASVGRDPAQLDRDEETLSRIGTFIELHIEQGRYLVDHGSATAIASSIWPHGRWRFDFTGEANHAGTTRMADRDDPMLKLAALTSRACAVARGLGCVATVGKVAVTPNGVNAIPSAVTGWLDARGPDEHAVLLMIPMLEEAVDGVAVLESYTSDTRFDPTLASELAALLGDAPIIATAAGHDAGVLAASGVRTAMLFVRNPTGVSHSPAEHAEASDCEAGAAALTSVLRKLAA